MLLPEGSRDPRLVTHTLFQSRIRQPNVSNEGQDCVQRVVSPGRREKGVHVIMPLACVVGQECTWCPMS